MDEKMLKAMVAAGAIKKIRIIGQGSRFHVEANTPNGAITAETYKGSIKSWVSLGCRQSKVGQINWHRFCAD